MGRPPGDVDVQIDQLIAKRAEQNPADDMEEMVSRELDRFFEKCEAIDFTSEVGLANRVLRVVESFEEEVDYDQ